MDVVKYLRRIGAQWRLVALAAAIVTIAVAGATFAMPKTYSSSATYFITSKGNGLDTATALAAGTLAQQKIVAYAAAASSEAMAAEVIKDLKLNSSPFDLRQKITAINTFGTALVVVTVTGQTPEGTLAIAESVERNYDKVLSQLDASTPDGNLNVVASMLVPPQLPTEPASPHVMFNILAGLASGLFLGIAIAAIRDFLNNRISTAEDLAKIVDVPVLVTITNDRELGSNPIATAGPAAEDFRRLRLNLKSVRTADCRMIAVTSSVSGEGTSTVAANLAAALAESDASVCVVDADLRSPRLSETFGISDGAVGLTSLLLGKAQLDEAIHDGGHGVRVVPSGPSASSPGQLLGSRAFEDIMGKLREAFDVVIVDTSALGVGSDAVAVASAADAALLVIERGRDSDTTIAHSIDALHRVEARVLGVVLNSVTKRGAMALAR